MFISSRIATIWPSSNITISSALSKTKTPASLFWDFWMWTMWWNQRSDTRSSLKKLLTLPNAPMQRNPIFFPVCPTICVHHWMGSLVCWKLIKNMKMISNFLKKSWKSIHFSQSSALSYQWCAGYVQDRGGRTCTQPWTFWSDQIWKRDTDADR